MQDGQQPEMVPKDEKNLTFPSFGGLDTTPARHSPADGSAVKPRDNAGCVESKGSKGHGTIVDSLTAAKNG